MLDVFEIVMDRLDDAYLRREQKEQDIERARQERDAKRNENKVR